MPLPSVDSFAGAAGVASNPPWTQSGLTAETLNYDGAGHGKASAINGGLEVLAFVNDNTFSADQLAKFTIAGGLGVNFNYAVVVLRGAKDGSASSFQGYEINSDGTTGAGHTEYVKWVNGASTVLGNFATTFATADIMEGRMSGTTISLWKNGIQVGSATDSTFARAGAPGAGFFNGSANNVLIDDFTGDNIGVAAVPDATPKALFPRNRLLLPTRPFGCGNPVLEMKWNDFGAGIGGPINTPISLDVISTFLPAATLQSAYNRALAVATAWTSVLAQVAARSIALAVSSTFAAALQRNLSRLLAIASTFAANLVTGRAYSRSLPASGSFVAAIVNRMGYQRALAVSSAFVAALTRQAGRLRTLAVTSTFGVAIQRGIAHALAVSSTFTAALTRKASYQRTLAIAATFAPAVNRQAAHFCALAVAATLAPILTVGRGFFRTLAYAATLAPALTKIVTHTYFQTLAATSTFTVAIARSTAFKRALAVASTYAPALVRVASHPRTLAVVSPMVAALQRGIAMRLAVSSVFAVLLRRGVSRLLAVAPPFVVTIVRGAAGLFRGFLVHIQSAFQVRGLDTAAFEAQSRTNAAFEVRRSR